MATGQCYNAFGDPTPDVPCGSTNSSTPFVTCCERGDTCTEFGLCHYTHSQVGGSGWYSGSCDDPKYSDKNCFRRCIDQSLPDVVYNSQTDLWACCGLDSSSKVKCPNPSDETFTAPSPDDLKSYYLAGSGPIGGSGSSSSSSTTSTSSSTTSTSSATTTTSATSSPTPSPSSGLSSGAKAGIGVGVAAGALAVIFLALAIFFQQRRKQRRRRAMDSQRSSIWPPSDQQLAQQNPLPLPPLPQQPQPLHSKQSIKHELPAEEEHDAIKTPFIGSEGGTLRSGMGTGRRSDWQGSGTSESGYSEFPEGRDRDAVEMDAQQIPRR